MGETKLNVGGGLILLNFLSLGGRDQYSKWLGVFTGPG